MLLLFRQFSRLGRSGFLLLVLTCSSSLAHALGPQNEVAGPEGHGFYLQIFGGAGSSNNVLVTQSAVAFFSEANGGPLAVNATGRSRARGFGFAGLEIGHEWSGWWLGDNENRWGLLPAVELAMCYQGGTQNAADLVNPTTRLPEHDFVASFPMRNGVFLANGVLSLRTPWRGVYPYIGAGLGTTYQSIRGANSIQFNPPEDINHFNSNPNASEWGFSTQLKVGVRVELKEHWHIFTDYRRLRIYSSDYTFGFTQSNVHVPTTAWNVHFDDVTLDIGVAGIRYCF